MVIIVWLLIIQNHSYRRNSAMIGFYLLSHGAMIIWVGPITLTSFLQTSLSVRRSIFLQDVLLIILISPNLQFEKINVLSEWVKIYGLSSKYCMWSDKDSARSENKRIIAFWGTNLQSTSPSSSLFIQRRTLLFESQRCYLQLMPIHQIYIYIHIELKRRPNWWCHFLLGCGEIKWGLWDLNRIMAVPTRVDF